MVLCADAVLDGDALIGDPTEGALIVLGAKGGLDITETRAALPRVAEVPFDSDYKFMATFHEMSADDGRPVVRCYVKGAPDVLIARATTNRNPDYLPFLDQLLHRSRDLFDRHVRIDAMLVEQVDRVGAEPPQRVLDAGLIASGRLSSPAGVPVSSRTRTWLRSRPVRGRARALLRRALRS